ncbi:MAG: type II toxin-antitoxin system MqsR family toxin [Clostridia bacterium]|nr:type II toxin-antitoxin system MqsR family toxin [Clostridia bacterium]
MDTIGKYIRGQNLLRIKRIVDADINGDKFIIRRRKKNVEFMREYSLTDEDVKNIVRSLTVKDCFKGPEKDRDEEYEGFLFFFCPMFEGIKLYIKIRIESDEKSVCLSVHEFGKYDEVGEV